MSDEMTKEERVAAHRIRMAAVKPEPDWKALYGAERLHSDALAEALKPFASIIDGDEFSLTWPEVDQIRKALAAHAARRAVAGDPT